MNNDILKNFVEQELNDHNKRNNAGLASVEFFDRAKTEEVATTARNTTACCGSARRTA